MAEKVKLQRVRSFYQLSGPGSFVSNPSDVTFGGSRRPYTSGLHVSSAKTHERTGSQLSKRISTAVDFNQRRHYIDTQRTLEDSRQILGFPRSKCPRDASSSHVDDDGDTTSETPEIIRPKRTITVILPSPQLMDDEDNAIAMDTHDDHAPLTDAERDSPMRNGASDPRQHLINDQRSTATASDDSVRLERSDRKKSSEPVYKLKYVHFDKNRAAVGHARQVADRLFAISLQRQTSAFSRIELS